MPRFTVKCSDPGCWWEEDRDYDDLQEAEDDIDGEFCHRKSCSEEVYIFDDH